MSGSEPRGIPIEGGKVFGRLAFTFLLLCAIAIGAACGLLFVYASDLPEIQALEDYRPNVVTELYGDDGQPIGSFALQRRILLTYEQIPRILRNAIFVTEDQHFEEHWGVDFPRVLEAMWRNVVKHKITEGASTLTMQLAGGLFLNRADRSFRRKIEETLLAMQIERHYTKAQIFTMYCNQIYLGNGNYGFEAASEYYFGKPVNQVTVPEAALLAGIIRGPSYSPVLHPSRARARRDLVLSRMAAEGIISRQDAAVYSQLPLGLHLSVPRNDLAPYFVEEIRQYLERTYGTEAVHEQGLRVYTTLNVEMQKAANQAVRDGLQAYDRRHGWRGKLPNIFTDHLGKLDTYQNEDWRGPIEKGGFITGLVMAVDATSAVIKIGPYRAVLGPADISWTGHKSPADILHVGDLTEFYVKDLSGTAAKVEVEQRPLAQGALLSIDNATGGVKAMVGGYSFEDSKFNRATQASRQTGSSFKVYVYATAIQEGMSPFDTVMDTPASYMSGGQVYAPHNYDEKFEGRITLRRALADSRNIPAVRILDRVGIQNVIETARKFGLTSALPPYLPLALGAADLTLWEHTSAFTVFPDDGIHIEPHLIRKVTTYDGATLEEDRPKVTDVIQPEVARTMVSMLEDVVLFGTGVRARELGRPSGGKTGTTNDFTDAWYIGFTPTLTTGVWVGNDDKRNSLGKKETGARAALPIWLEYMKVAVQGTPAEAFPNVIPLEKLAGARMVQVDTPDTAPPTDAAEQGLSEGGTKPAKPVPPKAAPAPPPAKPSTPSTVSTSAAKPGNP
ncbi:MAG: penicillin-binding protein 1A [Candidatus Acidiferrales bacterium]